MENLLSVDVKNYIEKRGQFDYLPWADAWREVLKLYPSANYSVERDEHNLPLFGNESMGYMVFTTVTIDSLTKPMHLPVKDHRNQIITKPNMTHVNKALMRCLTKNLAVFGLGLDLYAGEDLQEGATKRKEVSIQKQCINALNMVGVTDKDRAFYREEMRQGKWDFNEDFLNHLMSKFGG